MKTLLITTALLFGLMKAGRAETHVNVEPANFARLQQEVRMNAHRLMHEAAKPAPRLGRVDAALQETIEAVSALTIQMPYEEFDSVEGNRIMRQLVKLAELRDSLRQHAGGDVLVQIEAAGSELAD